MIKNKQKWITILCCLGVLIILSGFGGKGAGAKGSISCADDLAGASLSGVAGRMPATSAKIFYESMIGRKLSSYTTYKTLDGAVSALKRGQTDALAVTDVTARYLTSLDESLVSIPVTDMADIEHTQEPRFEFGFAIRNDNDGERLLRSLNEALDYLRTNGILDDLADRYIDGALEAEPFTTRDMVLNNGTNKVLYEEREVLYVGITGAVAPLELLDNGGEPYGYCVALMDEVGQLIQRRVGFVVLDGETAFSNLMSGRIDVVFAYGAGRITTEGTKNWLVSDGYYPMQRYEFVTLKQ